MKNIQDVFGDDDDDDGGGGGGSNALECAEPKIDASLQTATWISIVASIVLLNLRNLFMSKLSPLRATLMLVRSILSLLVAAQCAVLLFFVARQTTPVVYFSAAVYALFSAWTLVAVLLDYKLVANFKTYARFDKERGVWLASGLVRKR